MTENALIMQQLAHINAKLDALTMPTTKEELLTRSEYLEARKISSPTLWREEKNGLTKPVIIGRKKYYKLPK